MENNNNVYTAGTPISPNLNVPPRKGGNLLKWILGLVLIAAIGGGYYLFIKKSQSSPVVAISSDMSTWKTYENNNFGFRFKYPEELQFKEVSTGKDLQLDSFIINGPSDYAAYLNEKPNYKITLYKYSSSATLPKHSQEDCNIPDTRPDVKRIECGVVSINGSSFVRALDQLNDKNNHGSLELTLLGTVNSADFIALAHIPSGAKQASYLEVIKNMLGTLEVLNVSN